MAWVQMVCEMTTATDIHLSWFKCPGEVLRLSSHAAFRLPQSQMTPTFPQGSGGAFVAFSGVLMAAPRASWKGNLRLSLVTCPIELFPATSEKDKVSFNQLNRKTGNRIRYKKVDAGTGDEVPSEDTVKAYQFERDNYVQIEPDELEAVKLDTNHTIEIVSFVPESEIDDLYLNTPYY
jgi:hypothetical protein